MERKKDEEYYPVCKNKNMILEKNNNGDFRMNFTIIASQENKYSIMDIIKERQLYDLLYELNKDITKTINIKLNENYLDDLEFIFVDLSDENNVLDSDEEIIVNLQTKTVFIDANKCEIQGINIKNTSNTRDANVNINDFNISVEMNKNVYDISLKFSILDDNIPEIIKMCIGLYLKKIFYKLKLYFE